MPDSGPAKPSGTTPVKGHTATLLAAQLADMIPGAATVRVSLNDPKQVWPHPHAIVKDEAGKTMELGRTTARVAARWILRVWPEADWTRPHTFDLADATLTRSDLVAGRGR
ncbi:transcriptional regulator [Streptomyces zagrosensis]|uniref:transcriptional regulator n=1 Tax=Streptomyces zagrosensis TaxID=1042984 RepID=UPI0035E40DB9